MNNNIERKPAWEVMMEVVHPGIKRARFLSLHTIAAVIGGYDDLHVLEKELRESGKVSACYCPYVKAPVVYLNKYALTYGFGAHIWSMMNDFIAQYPYPQYKGFRRNDWYGDPNAMDKPFIKEDKEYATLIVKALKEAGYEPKFDPSSLE